MSIKRQVAIQFAKEDNYIPLTYDRYDEEQGWLYKEADESNVWFFRHAVTGQMFKWNQRRAMFRHAFDVKMAGIVIESKGIQVDDSEGPVSVCRQIVEQAWDTENRDSLIMAARVLGVNKRTARRAIRKAYDTKDEELYG